MIAIHLTLVRQPVSITVSIAFVRKLIAIAVVANQLALIGNTVAVAIGASTERNIANIWNIVVVAVREGLANIGNPIVIAVNQ